MGLCFVSSSERCHTGLIRILKLEPQYKTIGSILWMLCIYFKVEKQCYES